jgi:hypothetical protein
VPLADGISHLARQQCDLGALILIRLLGTRRAIVLVRTVAATVTIASLSLLAELLWSLPVAVDATLAFSVAASWAVWLEGREVR